ELKKLEASAPPRPLAMGVAEEKPEDTFVRIRGNVHNRGEKVPRGVLQVATAPGADPRVSTKESGRRELAAWLAGGAHPLTARVMANRAWHWLFGAGIVRTVDEFGAAGERPSHPELLDHLALKFVEEGWSVKRLVRAVVLSRTYQLSSVGDAKALAADPE